MAEDVKITILSENTSEKENLAAEYGLSMGSRPTGPISSILACRGL